MSNIINSYRYATASEGGEYPEITPASSTVVTDGNYKYVILTGSEDFDVDSIGSSSGSDEVEWLLIAGGGSGGNAGNMGGGGGAGGYLTGTETLTSTGSGSVTVGGGGAANRSASQGAGSDGNDSTLAFPDNTYESTGGGEGGYDMYSGTYTFYVGDGGSGGGASGGSLVTGETTDSSQGNDGGAGGTAKAGGGGGADAVGMNSSTYYGGAGGNGLSSSITGSAVTRAGGGGGSAYNGTGGDGGTGGGGAGATWNVALATTPTAFTGSGGGGGNTLSTSYPSNGADGVAILRWQFQSGGGSDYVTIDVDSSLTIEEDQYDTDYKYFVVDGTLASAFEVTDAGSESGSNTIEVYLIGGGGGAGGQLKPE